MPIVTDQDRARWERDREKEAERLEADLGHLAREEKRMRRTAGRLRGPLDVDELVVLAKRGEELTQAELAVLATEAPDTYNEVFERRLTR